MIRPTRTVHIDGAGKHALETGRTRLLVAGAVFALAFTAIAGRLVDISLVGSDTTHRTADARAHIAPVVKRGDIVDRNGVLVATSLPTVGLYADSQKIAAPRDAAARLSAVLPHLDSAALAEKLASGRSFVWLDRTLTPRQQHAVNALGIAGLEFEPTERRVYPQGRLAVHVLGATDVDNRGLTGIERRFDKTLSAGGAPLALSLDMRVQHVLADELRRAMETFEAVGAAGTVLDARTGEVLAMVSFPDFEPNDIGAAASDARFNRISLGVYELGSTFKLFNTAMALDSGKVQLDSRYDATQPLRVARFAIRDFKPQARWLSVAEILLHSSNIGSAQIALEVGGRGQRAFLDSLGMLSALPVELPEVGEPLHPKPWRDINTMTISFGHGIAVSPLHLAAGVSAMVNGGYYNAPTLLRRTGRIQEPGNRVIKPRTSSTMRKLMRAVVSDGTGSKAQAPGYRVGGKTGTAEKQRGGRYARKSLISSFVAAFPMDAPRYVVFALLDEPKGNKQTFGYATGGWVAAPVAGATIRRIAPMLGVVPRPEDDPEIIEALHLDLPGKRAPAREVRHRKPAAPGAGPQLASF